MNHMPTTVQTPPPDPVRSEQRMLRLSTVSAAVFSAVAVTWGVLASSQVIVLDGVYALIGVLLGGLSLRAAVLVERGPTARYPFGREALAPLVVGVQGMVLVGSLAFAVIDAIEVIATGGSETEFGSALVYAVASTVAGLLIWQALVRGGHGSELVAAEAAQWRAGTLLSVGMIAGFASAIALTNTAWDAIVPFIDPAMVIVAALFIAPTPVSMLAQMYNELLEGAVPSELAAEVEAEVVEVSRDYGLPDPTIRVGKLGRKIYVEIDYLVAEGEWSVSDADRIRRRLVERLREPGRLLWITVELHTDPTWDVD